MPKRRSYDASQIAARRRRGGHADGPGGVAGVPPDAGPVEERADAPGAFQATQGVVADTQIDRVAMRDEARNNLVVDPILHTNAAQFRVQEPSATRHRIAEDVLVGLSVRGEHVAGAVHSLSGEDYDVRIGPDVTGPDNASCNCPHWIFRVSRGRAGGATTCRHIDAVRHALGIMAEEQERARMAEEPVVVLGEAAAPRPDEEAPDTLSPAMEWWGQAAGHQYSDPVFGRDLFEDHLREVSQPNYRPAYATSGVLPPTVPSVGFELEYMGIRPGSAAEASLGRDLYAAGLTDTPHKKGYHAHRTPGKWSFENDGSVDGEIISPIIRDDPEYWEGLRELTEILRRHGARLGRNVGGHIHVDAGPLDTSARRAIKFGRIWRANEALLYGMGAAFTIGSHRGTTYARQMSDYQAQAADAVPRAPDGTRSEYHEFLARISGSSRYSGFNLSNIWTGRSNTVEFRIPNGSFDPVVLQQRARLAAGMVEAARHWKQHTLAGFFPGRMAYDPSVDLPRRLSSRMREANYYEPVRQFLDRICGGSVEAKKGLLWLFANMNSPERSDI